MDKKISQQQEKETIFYTRHWILGRLSRGYFTRAGPGRGVELSISTKHTFIYVYLVSDSDLFALVYLAASHKTWTKVPDKTFLVSPASYSLALLCCWRRCLPSHTSNSSNSSLPGPRHVTQEFPMFLPRIGQISTLSHGNNFKYLTSKVQMSCSCDFHFGFSIYKKIILFEIFIIFK